MQNRVGGGSGFVCVRFDIFEFKLNWSCCATTAESTIQYSLLSGDVPEPASQPYKGGVGMMLLEQRGCTNCRFKPADEKFCSYLKVTPTSLLKI